MDDKLKKLVIKNLSLKNKNILFCIHLRNKVCEQCMKNIAGDVSEIIGDVSEIIGDVSEISGGKI